MSEEELEVDKMSVEESPVSGGRRRRRNKSRKSNNALKEWVAFVKKVQKEENIDSYKKAMSRAKVRADKGEKWRSMKGGDGEEEEEEDASLLDPDVNPNETDPEMSGGIILGGKRKTRRRSASRTRRRTARRARGRSARRSRGRSARRSRGRH